MLLQRSLLRLVLPVFAIIAMSVPALAHSTAEFDEWEAGWEDRLEQHIDDHGIMSPELLAERSAFLELHPEHVRNIVAQAELVPPVQIYPQAVERWSSLVIIHFKPEDVPWAMRVMNCESQGNQYAQNPTSTAKGLFQFLDSTWRWASEGAGQAGVSVFDAEVHVEVAAWLYYEYGPSQWSCK